MVLALSAAYVRYGGLSWMQAIFYGIGASVIAIIARSAYKLTKLTLRQGQTPLGIFVVLAVTTAWTSREIVWLFLVAGVVALSDQSDAHKRQVETIRPSILAVHSANPVPGQRAYSGFFSISLRQDCLFSAADWRWCHFSMGE